MTTEKKLARNVHPGERLVLPGRTAEVVRVEWLDMYHYLHVLLPGGAPMTIRVSITEHVEVVAS